MDHGFFHSSTHNYQQKHQPNKHNNNNNINVSNNKDNININVSNNKGNNNKKRLTQEQVRLLERTFTTNKKLEPELKLQLANQLGVPPRQVAIWYQNKRARWKTQSLELDHNTLQLRLESAMSDKRRLEKQVLNLQEELRKAQEMLIFFNQQQQGGGGSVVLPDQPHHHHHHHLHHQVVNGSCNSSSDEGAASSSNLQEEVNGEVLQLDELYACLIGGGEGITWC